MRQILIRQNLDEISRVAGDLFRQIASDSISARNSFTVALAGGSTPRPLYALLATDASIDWQRVWFFLSDERNVPPDSQASNYRMVNETLFEPLKIEKQNIARWRTELEDVKRAADEYEIVLESTGRLDLVLLGLGADAHTASLFPGSPALHENKLLAVPNWVEKLGDHRLTMTFPAINEAANVVFLVSGDDKAAAVKSVLEGEINVIEYPAQGVRPKNGRLYWLLDQAAASGLAEK